ncbi:MAG: uracil-DNA glycosylase [Clostridia bacterium]|nr:uracil-DNA glycosylase [Clostridia bacterium]
MNWEELEEKCAKCTLCGLSETRTNTVFGCGDRKSRIMFVGEAPGEHEDLEGVPFVGRAGKLLDDYFKALEIDREKVYICNILKCRPPKNRDPLPAEEDACMDYLRWQVRLINPKYIVCLGRIAAQRLIGPDFKMTVDHGKWFAKGPFYVCGVFHPSYLLRNPAGKKEEMLTDLKMIKKDTGI